KLPHNRLFRVEDTVVLLSVIQRRESKLVKCFDSCGINWNILENELQKWSRLSRFGKRLTFNIAFNYMETGDLATSARQGTKRGYSSAT
ncbi:hypothetical protein B0T09DRAFT_251297, partial [Sordaria sp. MPI-SDFR-AT-0083]